jgi:hypothetical protein
MTADPAVEEQAVPDEQRLPKVEPARKVLSRGRDLFAIGEGHLLAIRATRFGEHVFDEAKGPVPVAEIIAVDLTGTEPQLLGVVGITWSKVIRALMAADPQTWQVGVLREGDNNAIELEPPAEGLDLDEVAQRLGRLRVTAVAPRPQQLALPTGEPDEPDVVEGTADEASDDDGEDDIPF